MESGKNIRRGGEKRKKWRKKKRGKPSKMMPYKEGHNPNKWKA